MKSVFLTLSLSLVLVAAPTLASETLRLSKSLARLSAQDVARRTTTSPGIEPDTVILSSAPATQHIGPSRGVYIEDAHLQIVINQRTGAVTWQVWHDLSYLGPRREPIDVSYKVQDQLSKSTPRVKKQWMEYAFLPDEVGPPYMYTRVVFDVSESDMRHIASNYEPRSEAPWIIQMVDSKGRQMSLGLAPAEVAGVVMAYDAWRKTITPFEP